MSELNKEELDKVTGGDGACNPEKCHYFICRILPVTGATFPISDYYTSKAEAEAALYEMINNDPFLYGQLIITSEPLH